MAAVVGGLHALAYAPLVSPRETQDSETYIAAAKAILHGSYSTPLHAASLYEDDRIVTDRTGYELPRETWNALEKQAFRTPGYPLFLALFGGGDGGISQLLVVVAQAVLLGGAVWLVGAAFVAIAGTRAALVGAWAFALDPWTRRFASLVLTEALSVFLLCAFAYVLVRAGRSSAARWWAVAGATVAALTLVRPAFVVLVPVPVLAALFARRWRPAVSAAAAAVVLLVPWLAWTASVVGRPVLATSPQGTNLLYAAHGAGERSIPDVVNDPAFVRDYTAPHASAPSAPELLSDREAHQRYLYAAEREYGDRALELYADRLRDEPLSVAGEAARRVRALSEASYTWKVPSSRIARFVLGGIDLLVLLLAVAGAWVVARRGGPGAWLCGSLLVFTAIFLVTYGEGRYGLPLRGIELALAAVAVVALVERLHSPRWS